MEDKLAILKKQSLLKGLTDAEIEKIEHLFKRVDFLNNEVIIEEGEASTELYLISEGEVSILKLDEDQLFNLPIGKLKAGDMFGEMSFMDGSPRSSTIETTKTTSVYSLPRKVLDELKDKPGLQDIYNKIITNIAIININRLRSSNAAHVKTLRTSLRRFELRQAWGKFLLAILLCGGLLNFVMSKLQPVFHSVDVYDWSYWGLFLILTIALVKAFHHYPDEFGITKEDWQKTLYEALCIVGIGIPLLYILSFVAGGGALQSMPWPLWLAGYLLYVCAFELIGRGVLISSIKKYLEDGRGWLSIVLAASAVTLVPLTSFLHVEIQGVFLFFIVNVVMGWIFLRQGSILGVILIHFVLGAFSRVFL